MTFIRVLIVTTDLPIARATYEMEVLMSSLWGVNYDDLVAVGEWT